MHGEPLSLCIYLQKTLLNHWVKLLSCCLDTLWYSFRQFVFYIPDILICLVTLISLMEVNVLHRFTYIYEWKVYNRLFITVFNPPKYTCIFTHFPNIKQHTTQLYNLTDLCIQRRISCTMTLWLYLVKKTCNFQQWKYNKQQGQNNHGMLVVCWWAPWEVKEAVSSYT